MVRSGDNAGSQAAVEVPTWDLQARETATEVRLGAADSAAPEPLARLLDISRERVRRGLAMIQQFSAIAINSPPRSRTSPAPKMPSASSSEAERESKD